MRNANDAKSESLHVVPAPSDTPPEPARVSVSLPEPMFGEAQLYAERHGLSLDEALRYLIKAGLIAEAAAMRDPTTSAAWAPGAPSAAQLATKQDRATGQTGGTALRSRPGT